jgi:pimeloyl-ACP methyl ester carboxylesterase
VHGIVGHSFGGKVALVSLAHRPQIRQAWLIDSMPGPDPGTTEPGSPRQVIATLFELEAPFASREAFVRALESRGIAAGVAHWLAMSLVEGPGGMRSRIDPAAVRELLADYAACDAWPTLEARTPGRSVHVIVAGRSTVWSAADRVRLAAAAARGTVTVHEMPDVGHWVHVEDPEGLVAILARGV